MESFPSLPRARAWRLVVAPMLALLATLVPCRASADFVDPTLWVTNPDEMRLAIAGDRLYAGGGYLSCLGPNTGGSGLISMATGERIPGWPRVEGWVSAAVPDGAGGWYLGGSFDRVAGVPRQDLAHVRADGTLDGWDPGVDGAVTDLVRSGPILYAAGDFSTLGGQTRTHLGALDATTGLPTAWNPAPDGNVYCLAVSGSTIYVGGTFGHVGGRARNRIAALDAASGLATPWNPDADDDVEAIVPSGSTVYVAGDFTRVGGEARRSVAALDPATGLATSWAPDVVGKVWALALSDSTVYLGGNFTLESYTGWPMPINLVAVDARAGLSTGWVPLVDDPLHSWDSQWDLINAIVVSGSRILVGGSFHWMGSADCANLIALDATTGLATDWSPTTNGTVITLTVSGDTVLAGGRLSCVGGVYPGNLAALGLTSGAAAAWNPAMLCGNVMALAVHDSRVCAGSGWWCDPPGGLAAYDATTAQCQEWRPNPDGGVHALAQDDSVVYAGGGFGAIGGQAQLNFAALDPESGRVTASSPDADASVEAMTWNGDTLVVGGSFTQFGGQARGRLAALDARTGVPTSWNPDAQDGVVKALACAGSTVYAGGTFSFIGGQPRTGIAALDATTGLATSWNPGTANTQLDVTAIAVNGPTVYAGGSFTTMGGKPRSNLAALDATTGLATDWDPAADANVCALAGSGGAVYAGGQFQRLGGRVVGGLARILPSPSSPPAVGVTWPNGGECVASGTPCALHWSASAAAPGVESVDLYLSRSGPGGPWALLAAGAPNTGTYAWDPAGTPASDDCWLRVTARDYAGNLSSDVSDAAFRIVSGVLAVPAPGGAATLALAPVAPNPARGSVRFEYALPRPADVQLSIVDVQGREVRVLAGGENAVGRHALTLDAHDLRPGLYFVRLRCGGYERSRRFVVVE